METPAAAPGGERLWYTGLQVYVLSILFSPFAGAWLLAENFRRMGRYDLRRHTLLATLLLMCGIIALVVTVGTQPDSQFRVRMFALVFNLGGAVTAQLLFLRAQAAWVAQQAALGYRRHTHLRALGQSLLTVVVYLVVAMVLTFALVASGLVVLPTPNP